MTHGPDGRITHIRYVLPRHKAANWAGPGRGRKSTRPGAGGCCDTHQKPRSHAPSRIAWTTLIARVGAGIPLQCPGCGGDIRLIALVTDPGPIRKILPHLGEAIVSPPVSPARALPTDWGDTEEADDDHDVFQPSPDDLPAIDIPIL